MRNEFGWYLGAIAPDFDHVWTSGVLTLDANVLLDLYRYIMQKPAKAFSPQSGCLESVSGSPAKRQANFSAIGGR